MIKATGATTANAQEHHTAPAHSEAAMADVTTEPRRKRTVSSPESSITLVMTTPKMARKRAHWHKNKLGQARQKTTMDTFVNIVKTPIRELPPD